MHNFHVIYLWIMMVGSILSLMGYTILATRNENPKPSTLTPRQRFAAQLIGTTVFMFWALTLLGKI